jgi:hypothetical protein
MILMLLRPLPRRVRGWGFFLHSHPQLTSGNIHFGRKDVDCYFFEIELLLGRLQESGSIKIIRFGLVGFGAWGRRHARAIAETRSNICHAL